MVRRFAIRQGGPDLIDETHPAVRWALRRQIGSWSFAAGHLEVKMPLQAGLEEVTVILKRQG